MSKKTYLSDQIRLMTLSTYDFFTDEEASAYHELISVLNQLSDDTANKEPLRLRKKTLQEKLSSLIRSNENIVRTVNLRAVTDTRFIKEHGFPSGISWKSLKISRRISEFASTMSRALELKPNDITFDKIIVKWKSADMLKQLVLNGFILPVLNPDGTVTRKHFQFYTASAGQLRTDKTQFISDEGWEKIRQMIECGLTPERFNEHGGININKMLAYRALSSSATDPWKEMDIDRCLVIKDFEAEVTGMMQYITSEYKSERGIRTVKINHCDGIGMVLPGVMNENAMCRGPWLKGLLTIFDFIAFCREHNVPAIINDVWGLEHDLVKENIQVLFTESQLKTWKYYESWDEYKSFFKSCGCYLSRTNYEEEWIADTDISYQMIQTLTDFTDDEIKQFTQKTHEKIDNISQDQQTMLHVLQADDESINPFKQALKLYPPLLREAYTRETLKAIKKRWIKDAKSGRIRIKNKRLFAIPDMYAACEFWFLHDEHPKGLLEDGECFTNVHFDTDELDLLRSPHLFMEHAHRKSVTNAELRKWFTTKGIYTSCHDLITRILQFDKLMSLYTVMYIENAVNVQMYGVA